MLFRSQTQLDSENGFTNAVKICIEKGILKEYLQRKSREVINMLVAEYDYDEPVVNVAVVSLVAHIAAIGIPPPIALAIVTMSGLIP